MSILTIKGWYKNRINEKPTSLGNMHVYVDSPFHLRLEQA